MQVIKGLKYRIINRQCGNVGKAEYIIYDNNGGGTYRGFLADGTETGSCNACLGTSDIELMYQGETMSLRTFKLKKASPTCKAGALFQETGEGSAYAHINPTDTLVDLSQPCGAFTQRSLVEENSSWFVEVFKVTPEYMTQVELDGFEAFKKSLAKRSAPKAPKK